MPDPSPAPSARIDSIDALRGFALSGIMLLHNLEQFNFYHTPEKKIPFLDFLDPYVWSGAFFLFGGKAYAIFSMLFGLSFFIMFSNLMKKGYDFGSRFAWRLFLLFGFGLVHSLYYSGDLLIFYSFFGLLLIPARRWGDRTVLCLSIFLLSLPLNLYEIVRVLLEPSFVPPPEMNWRFWGELAPAQSAGSLWELVKADVTSGLPANVLWTWEVGRAFHIPGLFLLGMLAARRKVFTEMMTRSWAKLAACALAAFLAIGWVRGFAEGIGGEVLKGLCLRTLDAYGDVAMMLLLVSAFVLLWRAGVGQRLFRVLVPYGRMSLTNYMSQAALGTFLYYNYGLGMHRYFGSTLSLVAGFAILCGQIAFSHWWLARHKQGPLETLWRRLIWLDREKPV
jgi:uncharacterized protein